MNLLKTIGKNIAFPALNWYKIGALVLVLVSWTVFVDQRARHQCELAHEKQKTEQVQQHAEKVAEHVESRLPIVAKKEQSSAVLRDKVETTKNRNEGYIYENETRNTTGCDLSDAEFDGMQQLIKQSREAAN